MGGIQLGHRHFPCPSDGFGKDFGPQRPASAGCGGPHTGSAVVHPGRTDVCGPHRRRHHLHARPAHAGRLDRTPQAARHGRRGTGGGARRRHQGIPGAGGPRTAEALRHRAGRGGECRAGDEPQHHRRHPLRIWQRVHRPRHALHTRCRGLGQGRHQAHRTDAGDARRHCRSENRRQRTEDGHRIAQRQTLRDDDRDETASRQHARTDRKPRRRTGGRGKIAP